MAWIYCLVDLIWFYEASGNYCFTPILYYYYHCFGVHVICTKNECQLKQKKKKMVLKYICDKRLHVQKSILVVISTQTDDIVRV